MKQLLFKKFIKWFLFFGFSYYLSVFSCWSAFEYSFIGARPAGLGGAYTALSDDVYSIYYNPAGLSRIQRIEFSAQYTKLYVGFDYDSDIGNSFIGFALPLKFKNDFGTIGFGWLQLSLADLYMENTFILSYSLKDIFSKFSKSDNIFSKFSGLDAGLSFKSLSLNYGKTQETLHYYDNDGNANHGQDSLFAKYGYQKSVFDLDIGFKYQLADNYKIGFSISNLTTPNISLENKEGVIIDRIYKIGLAHIAKEYSLGIDLLSKKFNSNSDWRTVIAAEKFFGPGFGLRGSLGIGSRDYLNFATGIGYKTNELQFDYAILYPLIGIKDTFGSHRVSLTLKFGPILRTTEDTSALKKQLEDETLKREEIEKKLNFAQLEINELKKKLEESLSKQPETIEKKPLKKEIKKEIKEKEIKPVEIPKEEKTYKEGIENEFKKEMKNYIDVSVKLNIAERLKVIKNIISKYENKLDIKQATDEYNILLQELNIQQKNYKESVLYYKKLVNRGISEEERIDLLNKIINKYKVFGIDISEIENELKILKLKKK